MAPIPKVVVAVRKMPDVTLMFFDGSNHDKVAAWLAERGHESTVIFRSNGKRVLTRGGNHYSDPVFFTERGDTVSVDAYKEHWALQRVIE